MRRTSDHEDREDRAPASAGLADRKEVLALGFLAAGSVLGLSLVSHDASGGNWVGPVGAFLARHLFGVVGVGAFVLPLTCAFAFVALVRPGGRRVGLVSAMAYLTLVVCAAMLLDLLVPELRPFGARPGGALGGLAADGMKHLFSTAGSVVLVIATMLGAMLVATELKVSRIALFLGAVGHRIGVFVADFVKAQVEQHRAERAERLAEEAALAAELAEDDDALAEAAVAASRELAEETPAREAGAEAEAEAPKKGRKKKDEPALEADADARVVAAEAKPAVVLPPGKKEKKDEKAAAVVAPIPLTSPVSGPDGIPPEPAWALGPKDKLPLPKGRKGVAREPSTDESVAEVAAAPALAEAEPVVAAPVIEARPEIVQAVTPEPAAAEALLPPAAAKALGKPARPDALPTIDVPPAPPRPKKGADSAFDLVPSEGGFSLPPLALLDDTTEVKRAPIDEVSLHATAEKLKQKLADFGIQGRVERIRPGPVVTMYEFAPAPGVKISKIAGLADDLAMALEAMRVRIVAPIPGRGVVGIEVPTAQRETVYLREILEQESFRKAASKLTMCIGKDIEGMPFVADLGKMPHVLISGTTGSGKSVSVNSMIMSLLFKATPEEVRFVMVDPKMLELSIYEGIPHLLLPVVTDPKKAALALRWAVDEMERRYELLARHGVRDLAGFNKLIAEKAARVAAGEPEPVPEPKKTPKKILIIDVENGETEEEAVARMEAAEGVPAPPTAEDLLAAGERISGEPVSPALAKKDEAEELRKLPYVVIIIDELADLMMVASKEVETYIARIAQKARAAGIHLMVATQRPSVDVVTGLIKANFPSRMAFMLRSRVDSQTILDSPGAEKLLGQGDMLMLPPSSAHLQRVHGALVTEKEIKRVVDHLKAQGKPVYDESILRAPEEELEADATEDDSKPDAKYDEAIRIVSQMKQVSVSILQRKLMIGYNRSARMVERMERDGIVGPANGSKPRDVLIHGIGELPNV